MTNHDEQERWRLEGENDKLRRSLYNAGVALQEAQRAELQLAEKLDIAEALIDKLQRQNEALRDVVRSAQLLTDYIHYQQNSTRGGTFGEAYDNLKAALRAWYEPNGAGR